MEDWVRRPLSPQSTEKMASSLLERHFSFRALHRPAAGGEGMREAHNPLEREEFLQGPPRRVERDVGTQ